MSCMFLPKVCAVVMFLFYFDILFCLLSNLSSFMFVVVVTLSFHTYNWQYPSYTTYNFLDINYDLRGEKGKLFPWPVLYS